MNYDDIKTILYTINNPLTGDDRDFTSLAKAKAYALTQDYTPVIIDKRDMETGDISDVSYKVINPDKKLVL